MIILDLFLLRDTPYRYAADNPKSPIWMPFLLLSAGILYGCLVAIFQRQAGMLIHGVDAREISSLILMGGNVLSGIFVALVFHGGVTLIVWLMAKGVGGPGNLGVLYRCTAFILPLAYPAFPYLAADAIKEGTENLPYVQVYPFLAALSFVLMAVSLFRLFRVSQGVKVWRAALATFMVFFFSASVLIL